MRAYSTGYFLAAGVMENWRRSADGVNWDVVLPIGLHGQIISLASADGRFVAYSRDHVVFASADGISWKELPSGPGSTYHPTIVLPDGYVRFGLRGEVWHSPDGVSWTAAESVAPNVFLANVVYGNSAMVALDTALGGSFNRLFQTGGLEHLSVGIVSVQRLPDGRVRLVTTAPPGGETQLESAPELGRWSPRKRAGNPSGVVAFADEVPPLGESRFYRVVSPPP